MNIYIQSCTTFEKSLKVTVGNLGFTLWWRLSARLGHALQCVFLVKYSLVVIFLDVCPFFHKEECRLVNSLAFWCRSGSLSTKLVTESKADVIFPNIFYNDIQALLILSYFALLHFKDIAFLQTEYLMATPPWADPGALIVHFSLCVSVSRFLVLTIF